MDKEVVFVTYIAQRLHCVVVFLLPNQRQSFSCVILFIYVFARDVV